MNSILAATLGGAIGGGAGAAIGALVDKLRGKPSKAAGWLAIVLGILCARIVPLVLPGPTLESQLDSASPVFLTIHKYYPDVFAQMIATLRASNIHDKIGIQNLIRPQLATLMGSHRAAMDDASSRALVDLMLAETQALEATSPEACVAILTGGHVSVDMTAVLPAGIQKQDTTTTSQIIEQVATKPAAPAAPLTAGEAQALAVAALKATTLEDQKLVLPLVAKQQTPTTAEQFAPYCRFYRQFFIASEAAPAGTLRRLIASK